MCRTDAPTSGPIEGANPLWRQSDFDSAGWLVQPAPLHTHEDEFVWVIEGELTLITDTGEELLRPGDCAAFKANDPDGHQFVNRSDRAEKIMEIGNTDPLDRCVYSDIDMIATPGAVGYCHRDGTPYPMKEP